MIAEETATVYRGGGRRWFTKDAAINAEAKATWRIATKRNDRCDCDTVTLNFEDFGFSACKYHDHDSSNKTYCRYMRYARHCILKAAP